MWVPPRSRDIFFGYAEATRTEVLLPAPPPPPPASVLECTKPVAESETKWLALQAKRQALGNQGADAEEHWSTWSADWNKSADDEWSTSANNDWFASRARNGNNEWCDSVAGQKRRRLESGWCEERTQGQEQEGSRDQKVNRRSDFDRQGPPAPAKFCGGLWETPRSSTGLKLVGELAPAHARWVYAVRDEARRSFAAHLPRVLDLSWCDKYYNIILNRTAWGQPEGPNGPIPRKTAWMVSRGCRCMYRYGRVAVPAQEYEPWMWEVMKVVMPLCGLNDPSNWPNACNLNVYEDGTHQVGWHTDDEPLFQGKFRDCLILSLSLGATRNFGIRVNWPDGEEQAEWSLPVAHGDLMTMEGMFQKHMKHRVPRERGIFDKRINLTWRWVVQHNKDCPASWH